MEEVLQDFSGRSHKIVEIASEESKRLNHEYIGTEHILLGLTKDTSCRAARLLKRLGCELEEIRVEVEKAVSRLSDPVEPIEPETLPLTPRATRSIEYAREEMARLNKTEIDPEHILIGLLRETEGLACNVLVRQGLDIQRVREELFEGSWKKVISNSPPNSP